MNLLDFESALFVCRHSHVACRRSPMFTPPLRRFHI